MNEYMNTTNGSMAWPELMFSIFQIWFAFGGFFFVALMMADVGFSKRAMPFVMFALGPWAWCVSAVVAVATFFQKLDTDKTVRR